MVPGRPFRQARSYSTSSSQYSGSKPGGTSLAIRVVEDSFLFLRVGGYASEVRMTSRYHLGSETVLWVDLPWIGSTLTLRTCLPREKLTRMTL